MLWGKCWRMESEVFGQSGENSWEFLSSLRAQTSCWSFSMSTTATVWGATDGRVLVCIERHVKWIRVVYTSSCSGSQLDNFMLLLLFSFFFLYTVSNENIVNWTKVVLARMFLVLHVIRIFSWFFKWCLNFFVIISWKLFCYSLFFCCSKMYECEFQTTAEILVEDS